MDTKGDASVRDALGEREHLLNIGFRMLGKMTDAEDVVQETYARWYRLTPAERELIAVPQAWLTRVASRICIDILGVGSRARSRRTAGGVDARHGAPLRAGNACARPDRRGPLPGPGGRAMRDGTLLAGPSASIGRQSFTEWLEGVGAA